MAHSGGSDDGDNLREWGLSFLRSPVEFMSDSNAGKVSRVKLEINKLEVSIQSSKDIDHVYNTLWDMYVCTNHRVSGALQRP